MGISPGKAAARAAGGPPRVRYADRGAARPAPLPDHRRLRAADVRDRPGHPRLDRRHGPGPAAPRLARQASPARSWSTCAPRPPRSRRSRPGPRHIVNLTAMRLVPAQHAGPAAAPRRRPRQPQHRRPPSATPVPTPAPGPAAPPGGWPQQPRPRPPAPAYQPPAHAAVPAAEHAPAPAEPAERTKAREDRRRPAPLAGHLRQRRDVRRRGPGAGRSPPRAAARRAGAPPGAAPVRRHVAVQDARPVPGRARRRAGRDGPRIDERLDPGPPGHVPRAGRRQAGHPASRATWSGSATGR